MAQEHSVSSETSAFQAAPKPFFDEDARLNPLMSIEALRTASPFFGRLFRRFTWLEEGSRSLHRRIWRSVRSAFIYFLAFTAFSFFIHNGADLLSGRLHGSDLFSEIVNSFWYAAVVILGISLLFDLLLDFNILGLSVGRDGEWELLRLSSLSRRGIVITLFAYWRLSYWERAMSAFYTRLISLVAIALTTSGFLWLLDNYFWLLFDGRHSQMIVLISIFVVLAGILLFEVRWRLNGLAALATALGLLANEDYALVARIGALLGSLLGQFAIAGISWGLANWIVVWYTEWQIPSFEYYVIEDWLANEVAVRFLIASVLFGVGLYLYFRLMRFVGLRLAYRAILREDGAA